MPSAPEFTMPEGAGWNTIWRRVCGLYLPYLHQNALAFRAEKKAFDYSAGDLSLPGTRTTDYRVWCRQDLQRAFNALAAAEQTRVREFLAPYGGIEALLADGVIDSGLDAELALPFAPRTPASRWRRAWVWLNGTPRQARA
jgi:hypothetical protein